MLTFSVFQQLFREKLKKYMKIYITRVEVFGYIFVRNAVKAVKKIIRHILPHFLQKFTAFAFQRLLNLV